MRVATFNIRMFPEPGTDRARVADTLVELDADIVAVQEIASRPALLEVLAEASTQSGRDYRVALSRCRHPRARITTGLVWDASSWRMLDKRDYPDLGPDEGGKCGPDQPGLLGVFEGPRDQRVAVLSVHLTPFPRGYPTRKKQWRKIIALQTSLTAELGMPVLVLGDFNSTGFTSEPPQEPDFVREQVEDAGFSLLTEDIACTEYYRPPASDVYLPSILDHVVASGGRWQAAEVQGLCERLACEVTEPGEMDPDFKVVSDHCPVLVEGTPTG